MTSWLTALRIARREARRAKGRSALVIAMIALPVLALAFAAASYDMFNLRPDEKADRDMGAADARLLWDYTGPVDQNPLGEGWSSEGSPRTDVPKEEELLALLPAGSRVIPSRESFTELRTAAGVGPIDTRALDVGDPLAAGLVTILDGRAPASDGEVAITEKAADRLGTGLGGTVQNPDRTRSWTVTAIVEFPGDLFETVVFRPGAMPVGAPSTGNGNGWLWDAPAPVTWEQVRQLNRHGMIVFSREVMRDPPPPDAVSAAFDPGSTVDAEAIGIGGLVAGLAILEIVLLAGPAFAVGARRRRRDLGLIAANGGTPAHLRRIVLADGVVLGAVGAAAGLVLGVTAAFVTLPLLEERLVNQRAGGYRVFPLALAGIATLAVGTGLLAALVPAFTAARGNVVAALTGRRGTIRSRKRWLVAGLALAGLGTAVTVYGARQTDINVLLAGLIIGELGLVLCTPTLVGLIARLGRVLPLAPRIALRDTARNRAASAPAIAAVMAAVAGSVALGVVLTADQERNEAGYRAGLPDGHAIIQHQGDPGAPGAEPAKAPDLDRVAAVARDTLPALTAVRVAEAACPPGTPADVYCGVSARMPADRECPWADDMGTLSPDDQRRARRDARCERPSTWSSIGYGNLVATAAALPVLTGATGDDLARAQATLAAGGILVGDPRYVVDGKVTLEIYDARQKEGTTTPEDRLRMPTVVVAGYAVGTGLPPHGGVILSSGAVAAAKLAERPSGVAVANTRIPTRAEEDRLTAALRDVGPALYVSIERGPYRNSDPTLVILAAAAGLITLGAAGIATGLAAADGHADLSTLAAVGASPGVRRRLSLSQSGVIAGLGTALGVAAGLGVSAAVLYAYNQAGADQWPVEPQYPVGVPWTSLAIVAVVPLVAMLGAGLLTRSRLPIEVRRAT